MKKHAVAICWVLVAAMTLAALLRLVLSPVLLATPMYPGSPPLTKGVILLAYPALVAASVLLLQWSWRSTRASPGTIQAWRNYWGVYHLIFALVMTASQALLLLNSLGIQIPVPFSPQVRQRVLLVTIGLVLVVMFNRLAKLPPLPAASSSPPDVPWGQPARLISSVMVGLGVMILITGLVGLTPQTAPFLSALLTAAFVLALLAIVYHFWRWHWQARSRRGS